MLAKRLSRLGLPVSAGVLATVLSREALAAGLPQSLVSSTITVARIFAAEQKVAGSLISAKAVALSGGVMKTMLTKAGIGLIALVVIATGGVGGGTFFYRTQIAKAVYLDAEQKSYTKAAPQGVEDVAENNGREGDDQPKQTAEDEISKELEKLQGAWVDEREGNALKFCYGEERPVGWARYRLPSSWVATGAPLECVLDRIGFALFALSNGPPFLCYSIRIVFDKKDEGQQS
jgi:hypothetical protein